MNPKKYFKDLEKQVKSVYAVCEEARKQGLDPVDKVEIPLAMTMAEKVVGLISTLYPQMQGSKIAERILELEKEYGKLDIMVSFKIAEEVSKQKFCKFASLLESIEAGIRVGFAYTTLGVVSSPIEGFTELKLGKTREGKEYFIAYFSGPIRSAGTTASCVVLMLIDYLRESFGFAKYDPSEEEIKRYIAENTDYHERITNLQYFPTEEEMYFLAKNLPIQISGEQTEKLEVSNYKNLGRVETNNIRGGMCLIFSEGLAQKAAKGFRLLARAKKKGINSTGFDFLEEYIKLHEKRDLGDTDDSPTYIKDLVAGRPIFGHPSRSGGFRFRYGRGRVSGFSAASIHPATMAMTDGFIAIGTQLKLEKPTKGCAVTTCDLIDGPIIKLFNGSVKKLESMEEAKKLYPDVEEIIYLGDILFPFSDLSNRNSDLIKPGYVEEWWGLELREKNPELEKEINFYEVSFEKAVEISRKYKIPLHPKFIFYWTEISKEQVLGLLDWLKHSKTDNKIIFPFNQTEQEKFKRGKRALELLGVEHEVTIENVVISRENSKALLANLGVDFNLVDKNNILKEHIDEERFKSDKPILEIINSVSEFKIKDKAGDFIGARMGRPEKAKVRKLAGSPNVLFPVGNEGGRLRSVQTACEVGSVKSSFPIYYCSKCKKDTIYPICENCGNKSEGGYYCFECREKSSKPCEEHKRVQTYCAQDLGIGHYLEKAIEKLGLDKTEIPLLIKGIRGTSSAEHKVESLAKGVLRAMYGLQVNKDGTIRFDATELPLTSFKPKEISVSIEKLKELGYEEDIHGKPLVNDEQIMELMPHDVILPCSNKSPDEKADDVFMRVATFVDDLLVKFYGLKPYYNIRKREDLVGQLGVCMAPHNCAGVICRFIGFSNTLGLFASPFMHAAIRRDCLGYGNYVSINKDGRWSIEKIGKFIDEANPEEKADNFGTLKKNISGISTWSNPGEKKIKEITKHTPTKLLKIYSEDGRQIDLTENHKVYLKGKKEKRAFQLQEGDKLMVGYKKNIQEKDIKDIFLPDIFRGRKDIMLRNIKDYLGSFERLNKNDNFWQRDSFPIIFVEEFLNKYGKTLKDLPNSVKIVIKRDNVPLPIRISFDKKLLEVLGLYVAEGFIRENNSQKGFYQVSIAATNNEVQELIKDVFKSHFNLIPSENHEDHLTFSSRIVYEIFKDYLGLSSGAKNKRIPSLFLDLDKEKLSALLRGYFEGDGSVSLSDTRVVCDTVSEGLKHDLSFVLSRFGIFTKFYEYEKEPGYRVSEFYIKKNREIPKFKITKITIPSNFVKKFEQIGFISERKKSILAELIQKSPRGMRIDFDENYAYPRIMKIEELGERESYCFNVDEEHNFFANEILVHNCDGDEAALMLLGDVLLNFSRKFLPSHRGGTQDAPLVLNAKIDAGEVDDQILDFEFVNEYPLELYRLAEQRKHSSEVKINNVRQILKQEKNPFTGFGFTHDTSDFNEGVVCSSYKLLATMQEKVQHQMGFVERVRAADTSDTVRLIIERHFIKDMKGNLRKFSMQEFRCVGCNEILRRPPLTGVCPKCKGKIIFTIHEGGIRKYLEPALDLAKKYNLSKYMRQNLELTKRYIDSIFGRESEKQEGLDKWV
ncbi:DNA polymerase II large subunit [archaeon BMS3Abin17]|nr:DNA polymerase II large subunit [archaeon BMS3Abin17]HDZ60319.1 DNA polymerase II large subunit [Candidatus Pacearchaeota archaeon]